MDVFVRYCGVNSVLLAKRDMLRPVGKVGHNLQVIQVTRLANLIFELLLLRRGEARLDVVLEVPAILEEVHQVVIRLGGGAVLLDPGEATPNSLKMSSGLVHSCVSPSPIGPALA